MIGSELANPVDVFGGANGRIYFFNKVFFAVERSFSFLSEDSNFGSRSSIPNISIGKTHWCFLLEIVSVQLTEHICGVGEQRRHQ